MLEMILLLNTMELHSMKNGEAVVGSFYEKELQKLFKKYLELKK